MSLQHALHSVYYHSHAGDSETKDLYKDVYHANSELASKTGLLPFYPVDTAVGVIKSHLKEDNANAHFIAHKAISKLAAGGLKNKAKVLTDHLGIAHSELKDSGPRPEVEGHNGIVCATTTKAPVMKDKLQATPVSHSLRVDQTNQTLFIDMTVEINRSWDKVICCLDPTVWSHCNLYFAHTYAVQNYCFGEQHPPRSTDPIVVDRDVGSSWESRFYEQFILMPENQFGMAMEFQTILWIKAIKRTDILVKGAPSPRYDFNFWLVDSIYSKIGLSQGVMGLERDDGYAYASPFTDDNGKDCTRIEAQKVLKYEDRPMTACSLPISGEVILYGTIPNVQASSDGNYEFGMCCNYTDED